MKDFFYYKIHLRYGNHPNNEGRSSLFLYMTWNLAVPWTELHTGQAPASSLATEFQRVFGHHLPLWKWYSKFQEKHKKQWFLFSNKILCRTQHIKPIKAFSIGQEEAATSFLCVFSVYVPIRLVPWTPFNCVRTIGQLSMWVKWCYSGSRAGGAKALLSQSSLNL